MDATIGWPLGLGLLGAIVGSFVAVLVVRWPEGRSVVNGRSGCDACGRTLRVAELVPVLSFIALGGRCRRCRARIDRRHLAVELIAAGLGVVAGLTSTGVEGAAGAVFGWLLLALAALDLEAFWLPDRLTGALAAAGLAGAFMGLGPSWDERLVGGVLGWAGLWLVGRIYALARGRQGLGGGDPKLLGAIGLWLGWRLLPAVLLIACLIGLGVVLGAAIRGRSVGRDTALPFGVFLATAAYPAWVVMLRLSA